MQLLNKWKKAYAACSVWNIEWAAAAVILVLMLCTYTYVDLESMTVWSTNVWDVLWEGRFSDFYAYCAANPYNAPHWQISGDMTGLLAWSVWNLPIWVLQRFFQMDILENPGLLLWSKLFLAAAFACMMVFTYRIAMLLVKDKGVSLLTVFLCASSMYVFTGIGYAGQNDILFLLPAVAGVYALLREKPRPWVFYLCAAVSIAIKPFFFFPYLAILLLLEKNFFRILLRVLYGVSGILLCRLLSLRMPYYSESLAAGSMDDILSGMFRYGINTFLGNASTFVIALCVLYVWCYLVRPDSREKRILWVVYAAAAGFMILLLCTPFQFYRPIFLIPFVPLMMMGNADKRNLNVLLDTGMGLSITCLLFFNGSAVYTPQFMDKSIWGLPRIAEASRVLPNLSVLLEEWGFLRPAFAAAAIACGAALLLINHPTGFIKAKCAGERCERWLLWVRLLLPAVLLLLSFVCYFWVQ